MPVQVSYPGVYVQEAPSGVRTITGVSTSTALFIGMTTRGRLGVPTRVLSFSQYQRIFGDDTVISEMTDQVRQFFLNGGQRAWVVRIADSTAAAAHVDLANEDGDVVMTITAKDAGVDGNLIRVEVDYDTPTPEATFNLRVFRLATNAVGEIDVETEETFSHLSMDSDRGRFVGTVVNQQSALVDVEVEDPLPTMLGFSIGGIVLHPTDDSAAAATLNDAITPASNSIQISVDGRPFAPVVLPGGMDDSPLDLDEWESAINTALMPLGAAVDIELVLLPGGSGRVVRIVSNPPGGGSLGSVEILPGAVNDVAVALQLGSGQGGLEIGGYASARPAPSGYFARLASSTDPVDALANFAEAIGDDIGAWTLADSSGQGPHGPQSPGLGPEPMYVGTASSGVGIGSLLNVRQNLQRLADSINDNVADQWSAALQGFRLVLRPRFGNENSDTSAELTTDGTPDLGAAGQMLDFHPATVPGVNVASYSLGTTGDGSYQSAGGNGDNGGVPGTPDYQAAFLTVESEVDLFNLLILPAAGDQTQAARDALWGPASSFCRGQRAFLLVDPRAAWQSVDDVDSEIPQLRTGVVRDHAAVYWPRLRIAIDGTTKEIDPSGSIAGLMARIDSNRGVWKAPAGIEASLLGVRGTQYLMSDAENGVINPQAVNAIRTFPAGVTSWGARTLDGYDNSGNDDYKYVPVRRLALFLEESLYRGLRWAVFEPNDEPLWAQIRLAAGAFMNNLFRKGAFQGQKARDAYFVQCDAETTTQNDVNLGIVNVVVGFAPLKPAEFVVITIRQKAGQVQV